MVLYSEQVPKLTLLVHHKGYLYNTIKPLLCAQLSVVNEKYIGVLSGSECSGAYARCTRLGVRTATEQHLSQLC